MFLVSRVLSVVIIGLDFSVSGLVRGDNWFRF